MKKDIQLIALDMDGTLLRNDHSVSDKNREAIKAAQEQGKAVMVSTGRPLLYAEKIVDSLKLSTYLITVNGGEIWSPDRALIERTMIDSSHVEFMLDMALKHDTHYWSSTVEGVFNRNTTFPQNIHDFQWLKFGFDIKDDHVRELIWKELSKREELEVTNSSLTNIEVNAAGINKAAAIRKVCKKLNISMDEVMAVGDSLNDLAMIKESGIGIAMENAQPKVKEAADWVTHSNENHGVAEAIRRFVLK
ncbi:Cof-type HAD-IIB family hydrolase [Jeotgalibacillus terrae]|uniref:Cof-type HAD-IIB family hydrolase n=1 Tax=Jeotgalibacillus terrae TaxID=587735 RepID=A0ABW5ZDA0_9BACL|nr:Cof-type HAD-IIB family hydrolase [Jeotgalibacillus terrae]MBM7579050.1 HAD superfamily hydrolase (TIGR01484 family) [Jeotgalibacillus terrae]